MPLPKFTPRVPHEDVAVLTKIPSLASIRDHPLHPMLVHFPIAFLSAALATDLAFWWTADAFWARVSFWLIAAGLAMGSLASLIGTFELLANRPIRAHPTAWSHFLAGVTLLSFAAANLVLRLDDPQGAILPWGLFLSFHSAVALTMTSMLGGHLVYHYLIGTGSGQVAGDSERSGHDQHDDGKNQ